VHGIERHRVVENNDFLFPLKKKMKERKKEREEYIYIA
jgi:hypothetical protein